MDIKTFKTLPLRLQLDSLLYVRGASQLICTVHVGLGFKYDDDSVIQLMIDQWFFCDSEFSDDLADQIQSYVDDNLDDYLT